MRILPPAVALLVSFVACHPGQASAEVPRAASPSVDVEIEDTGGGPARTARFSLALVDGKAEVSARDADAKVTVLARSFDTPAGARVAIEVRRAGGHEDMSAMGAIPDKPSGRVLVARIERPGGGATSVVAQVR